LIRVEEGSGRADPLPVYRDCGSWQKLFKVDRCDCSSTQKSLYGGFGVTIASMKVGISLVVSTAAVPV
jgi:hypothetical protein